MQSAAALLTLLIASKPIHASVQPAQCTVNQAAVFYESVEPPDPNDALFLESLEFPHLYYALFMLKPGDPITLTSHWRGEKIWSVAYGREGWIDRSAVSCLPSSSKGI